MANLIKRTADRGYLYEVKSKDTTKLEQGKWYQVLKQDAKLPASLKKGDIWQAASAENNIGNEVAAELELEKVCFANVVNLEFTKEKLDTTTWCDDTKSYTVSRLSDATGSFEGFFDPDSELQIQVLSAFIPIIQQKGNNVTKKSNTDPKVKLMHSILEEAPSEHNATWRYMPIIIDSVSSNASGSEVVQFTCNFTLDGAEHPQMIMIETS